MDGGASKGLTEIGTSSPNRQTYKLNSAKHSNELEVLSRRRSTPVILIAQTTIQPISNAAATVSPSGAVFNAEALIETHDS